MRPGPHSRAWNNCRLIMRSWVSNWLNSRSPLETHSACHWFHWTTCLMCLSPLFSRHVLILLEQAGKQRGCWQCGWRRMPKSRASPRRGRGSANKQKRCRAKKQKRWGNQSWKRNMVERVDDHRSHMNRPLSDASNQRWCVLFYSDHMPPMSLLLRFTSFSTSDCVFVVFSRKHRIGQNELFMSKTLHEPATFGRIKAKVMCNIITQTTCHQWVSY